MPVNTTCHATSLETPCHILEDAHGIIAELPVRLFLNILNDDSGSYQRLKPLLDIPFLHIYIRFQISLNTKYTDLEDAARGRILLRHANMHGQSIILSTL